jgi:hypothetical protein
LALKKPIVDSKFVGIAPDKDPRLLETGWVSSGVNCAPHATGKLATRGDIIDPSLNSYTSPFEGIPDYSPIKAMELYGTQLMFVPESASASTSCRVHSFNGSSWDTASDFPLSLAADFASSSSVPAGRIKPIQIGETVRFLNPAGATASEDLRPTSSWKWYGYIQRKWFNNLDVQEQGGLVEGWTSDDGCPEMFSGRGHNPSLSFVTASPSTSLTDGQIQVEYKITKAGSGTWPVSMVGDAGTGLWFYVVYKYDDLQVSAPTEISKISGGDDDDDLEDTTDEIVFQNIYIKPHADWSPRFTGMMLLMKDQAAAFGTEDFGNYYVVADIDFTAKGVDYDFALEPTGECFHIILDEASYTFLTYPTNTLPGVVAYQAGSKPLYTVIPVDAEYHNQRMWGVAGKTIEYFPGNYNILNAKVTIDVDYKNRFYFSEIAKPDTWLNTSYREMPTKSELIAITKFQDRLLIFSKTELFVLDVDGDETAWGIDNTFSRGIDKATNYIDTDHGVVFLSVDGQVYLYNGESTLTMLTDNIVAKWMDAAMAGSGQYWAIDQISDTEVRIFRRLRSSSGDKDNESFVYDLATSQWRLLKHSGAPAYDSYQTQSAQWMNGGVPQRLLIEYDENSIGTGFDISEFDVEKLTGYNDDNEVVTREFSFGDGIKGVWYSAKVIGKCSSPTKVTLTYSLDSGKTWTAPDTPAYMAMTDLTDSDDAKTAETIFNLKTSSTWPTDYGIQLKLAGNANFEIDSIAVIGREKLVTHV